MKIPDQLLDSIRQAVGDKGCTTDPGELEPHVTETRGLWRGTCAMAVSPATTDEVSAVMALCFEAGVAVVPQGGNTGLVGGGVPDGGIVLSLARLNKIRAIDPVNFTLTAEAGCILKDVQDAAAAEDRLFPLSLGAEGSCRIGGNLATNAGGVHVLRYGNTRDLTLGLEVVLADGRVWDGLRGLRKDNTGYDLKQLFIGAEGTLGVITAAVLKLFPRPGGRQTALCGMPGDEDALKLFVRAQAQAGDALTAFEFMSRPSVDLAAAHVPGVTVPLAEPHGCYVLIDLTGPGADGDGDSGGGLPGGGLPGGGLPGGGLKETLESILAGALEDGVIDDAVIAASETQAQALWQIREAVPEAQRTAGASIKHDISVPVSKVPEFLKRATEMVEAELPGIRVMAFGHLGDGNIHFNLSQPDGMDADAFLGLWRRFNGMVHDLVHEMDGSFSAEHGIGTLKKDDLVRYKSAVELELMKALKQTLDPKGIMNPGKVL